MRRFLQLLTIVPVLTGLSACSDSTEPLEITEVRELSGADQKIRVVASEAERYRMPSRMRAGADEHEGHAHGPGEGHDNQGGDGAETDAALPFAWTTPEGWERRPGSPMRDLSFAFGEEGEGECYISRLPGAGGGLAANVNRWRRQLGQGPLSGEEIATLPKKTLFGIDGVFVDVSGDFSGMGGGGTKKDYRLLGVIVTSEAGAVFVKMTGPADLIAANEKKFDSFCASLRPRS